MKEKKRAIKFLGTIATLFALLFIIKKLYDFQWGSSYFEIRAHISELAILVILYAFSMILVAVPWRIMVEFYSGRRIPHEEATFVLCKSNLYKYIPGNVFQYIGRNELAARNSISHGKVALATITDIIFNFGSVMLLSLLLCRGKISAFFAYYGLTRYQLAVYVLFITGVSVGTAAVIWFARRKLLQNQFREAIIKGIFCIFYYFFLGIYTALMFVYITVIVLSEPVTLLELPALMGGYLFGWIAGFVMPGAPGGIGIREAVTVLMLSASFSQQTVLLAILLYRLINVLGDVLAFGFAVFLLKIRKSI